MNEEAPKPKKKLLMRLWFGFFVGLAVATGALFIAFITLRAANLVRPYSVPANSMADFIRKGDGVMTESFSILTGLPNRGDVVVFSTEGIKMPYMPPGPPQMYIKRVVGLPGDELEFKGDVLHINGKPVSEFFDVSEIRYVPMMRLADGNRVKVPQDHLFVMGDNSANSSDSRFWGPVPVKNLQQKYWFHYHRAEKAEEKPPESRF
ncbi:MAG: hypothetical protein RLZZ476_2416 [Verrucomicrobiota bacterium]|jgi:signal peptidase I